MAKKEIELNEIDNAGSLGSIQNKAIIGGKAELSDAEKASLEAFNSKPLKVESNISDGWVLVDRTEMGLRSDFYPAEWEFYIKAAPVMSIKNWSSVDEERADHVNHVMNEIIRTSVKVVNGAGWGSINSWDRFWFIMKVRELTFYKGETKIEFEDECSECHSDIIYTLNSKGLFYEFPDEDLIEKHWDGEKWYIDPSDYDLEESPITLYNPTLGKDAAIIEWATQRARAKSNVDENFIRFFMWMLPKTPKDINLLDKHYEREFKAYKNWSFEKHEFMEQVIRNLTINPSEQLRCQCPNCGAESTSKVRFPNGIKRLFTLETGTKKFGSR